MRKARMTEKLLMQTTLKSNVREVAKFLCSMSRFGALPHDKFLDLSLESVTGDGGPISIRALPMVHRLTKKQTEILVHRLRLEAWGAFWRWWKGFSNWLACTVLFLSTQMEYKSSFGDKWMKITLGLLYKIIIYQGWPEIHETLNALIQ